MKKRTPKQITKLLLLILLTLGTLIMVSLLSSCTSRTAKEAKSYCYHYNDTMNVHRTYGNFLFGKDTVPIYNDYNTQIGIMIIRQQSKLSNIIRKLPNNKVIVDTVRISIISSTIGYQ